jgi:hypothetical protein
VSLAGARIKDRVTSPHPAHGHWRQRTGAGMSLLAAGVAYSPLSYAIAPALNDSNLDRRFIALFSEYYSAGSARHALLVSREPFTQRRRSACAVRDIVVLMSCILGGSTVNSKRRPFGSFIYSE